MADDTPSSVPNMMSWADEASDSEATDEEEEARLEAEEQAAEAQRIEDEWNGPRAEGSTLEDLADALEAQALANGERDPVEDSNSDSDEDDDEPEPEPEPIPVRKVPELEKQLSKKELKKLADAAFEAELMAAMGEVGETLPAAEKAETKAEAPAAAAAAAAAEKPAGDSAAAKKKRKKKAKKKAGGGGGAAAANLETAAAETPKPLSEADIEAKKKALAAKMARGDVKKAAERKKKAEMQKENERKRKEAAKKKKYAASAGVSGPKFSGDNAVGGDGRGG